MAESVGVHAGRDPAIAFLTATWRRAQDYRLVKGLWAHDDNRIAVRLACNRRDVVGAWYRSYGNENREFAPDGPTARRIASISNLPI